MNETIIRYRNKISHGFYTHLLKPIFFRNDPESVHDRMTMFGVALGKYHIGQKITKFLFDYQNNSVILFFGIVTTM